MPIDFYSREKGPGYAVAFLYSAVVAVLWIPAFVLRHLSRFLMEAGVETWPRANGSITAGNVTVIHGWVVDYALGRLDYCYRVAGEYYAGSVTRQYPDEQAAWDFVDHRRAKPIVVRYKDDNALASALRDADQEPSWTDGTERRLFAMVWQHWRDELRGEPMVPEDRDLQCDDETLSPRDQKGR
jgi:hypothetical protein